MTTDGETWGNPLLKNNDLAGNWHVVDLIWIFLFPLLYLVC